MRIETFDAVEMQDYAAQRLYAQTKGMTLAEQLEFWRKRTDSLQEHQRAIQKREARVNSRRTAYKSHRKSRSRRVR